ncbi:GTPase family protein [Phascolarctobacterium sp.]|uniref:GTPase family protein n=1 Tax=Phascolarctobacterium sp. TaxID=2049039 RepID=UPI00386C8903
MDEQKVIDVETVDIAEEAKDKAKSIYEALEEDIMNAKLPDGEKTKLLSKLIKNRSRQVNIMLVGSTGSGKSSTINAMFNMEVAKVGVGVDPETAAITKYELENLIIWDTPGLGDSIAKDKQITKAIIGKLNEEDAEHKPLIDLVVVVMDAASKDLGTSYKLINDVLVPCLGNEASKRILLGINQSDVAMKGKHWDAVKNEPDTVLLEFLKKKAASVQARIKEATDLDIVPIYYCAGYKEEGGEQCKPYNLTKLLYHLLLLIPQEKRLALVDNIRMEKDNWTHDDHEEDYMEATEKTFGETVLDSLWDGAEFGVEVGGKALGIPGKLLGGLMGGTLGILHGIFRAFGNAME